MTRSSSVLGVDLFQKNDHNNFGFSSLKVFTTFSFCKLNNIFYLESLCLMLCPNTVSHNVDVIDVKLYSMHPLRKSRASDVQIFSIILIFHNTNYFFILSDLANGQRGFDGLGIIHKKEATTPLHTQFEMSQETLS